MRAAWSKLHGPCWKLHTSCKKSVTLFLAFNSDKHLRNNFVQLVVQCLQSPANILALPNVNAFERSDLRVQSCTFLTASSDEPCLLNAPLMTSPLESSHREIACTCACKQDAN